MLKKLIPFSFLGCILYLNFVQKNNTVASAPDTKTEKIYTQYCSSCHGEKVEAFVDRTWKHGKSKAEIVASITNGYVDLGMPTWKPIIEAKDIDKLADLIVKNIANVDQYKVSNKPTSNIFKSDGMTVSLDTIATGFESPWGFAQLPNGQYLITDRAGVLYLVDNNRNKTIIKDIPKALAEGQGGLLDIELHPNFVDNGWVYLSYSKFKEENGTKLTTTAIVRGKLNGTSFTEAQEIFEAQPYTKTKHHFGSRIVFDKNGYLFFSVVFPQSTENDNGKIHRLNDDGSVPKDNPFVNDSKNRGSIYSYGHRNPQGLTLNKETGEIWEHEHGPRGGDEVNIIKKNANFGWPVISYGINYDGKPITNISKKEGMEQPEIYWLPSIAPSGMTFVNSDKYPAWKGNLMVGSLRFNYLNRCIVKNNKIVGQEKLLVNVGRMRNVEMGSDGYLYVSIENPGTVFRIKPN
jgi:aldose sugar dehydrogenase